MLTDKEQEEIRRKLLGLEEEPPAAAWQKIAADIKPPRKPRPVWWWFAGALVLSILSVGLYYYKLKPAQPQTAVLNQTEEAQQPTIAGSTTATEKQAEVESQKIGTTITDPTQQTQTAEAETESIETETINPDTEKPTATRPITSSGNTSRKILLPIAGEKPKRNSTKAETTTSKETIANAKAQSGKTLQTEPIPGTSTATDSITQEQRQTGKTHIPLIAGTAKPKNKLTGKYSSEKRVPTETIVAAQPKSTVKTVAAEQEKQANAQTQIEGTNTKGNDETLLAAKEAQLPESSNLTVPDSVSITSEADSLLKKLASVQIDSAKHKKQREWYVGMHVASRYAFRQFTPTATDNVYITKLNNYEPLDPNRLGYEVAFNAGKQLKQNLYLETSISLMQLREDVSYAFTNGKVDTLLKSRTADGSYHATPVYVQNQRQLKSAYTYGGLRVGVNYYFLQNSRKRLNLTLAGGANLLLKGQTTEYINGIQTSNVFFPSADSPLEQTNYNLLAGIGYNITLPKNYELTLMPNLNYFLGSTFSNREPFGLKPYTLGLSVQVKKRFIQ
ncbi:hypothetical protein WG947_07870 [Pontibacter sp. H259]|uniref:hypothetical protein n=1 Tax=Pontibacter sp. H259 TaxID=3133421 RepID=UPI0030BC8171